MVVGVKVHLSERQIEEVFGPSGCDRLDAHVVRAFFHGDCILYLSVFLGARKTGYYY